MIDSFITRIFDRIARAITSLGAVIFVLLLIIAGMIFFSHTLFIEVFPATMSPWEKEAATWVVALGWELTVLITTSNKQYLRKGIPELMALASGVIVLFFIQAFDTEQSALTLAMRWFVGILVASINWIYADLFTHKWKERNKQQELPLRLQRAESLNETLARSQSKLQSQLNERESTLTELRSVLKDRDRDLKQLQSKIDDFQRELTCPHCKQVQSNPRALNAHKGHCPENPINKNQNI